MSKTKDAIKDFQPQWKNKHANDCPVTKQREDLWSQFVKDPTSEGLYGAVIEYDGFGDQEVENCDCYVCGSGRPGYNPQENPQQATVLSVQARALAQHIEAFNILVCRNTDTHDGEVRGEDWAESGRLPGDVIGGQMMDNWNRLLCDLADLWDFG